MKRLSKLLIPCVGMLFFMSPFALAQTPDGETPAEETVCDVLKADGVTKGLYGLCIAFCEAHDAASLSDPLSEPDYDALFESMPSGRILENYIRKKDRANNPNDPEMPCIKVAEACPCWSSEEAEAIAFSTNEEDECVFWEPPPNGDPAFVDGARIRHNFFQEPYEIQHISAFAYNLRSDPRYQCIYEDWSKTPRDIRLIAISPEQFSACNSKVRELAVSTGRSCQIRYD